MLDAHQFLNEIRNKDPHLGKLLEQLIDGLNGVSNHIGVDPTGKVAPPDPHQALNISAGSDQVHVTITDNSQIRKNVNYFVAWSANDPAFQNAHVEPLGPSRGKILPLPAKDGSGVPIQYYFKSYGQYVGSDPQSEHTFFGPKFAPTPVTLTGASTLALLPSTGSGTGKPDGSQSGAGLGVDIERLPVGPKRPAAPEFL